MESEESVESRMWIEHLIEIDSTSVSNPLRISRLHLLYKQILVQLTDDSYVQLTSSYSRLSYLISHYAIQGRESYLLHSLRVAMRGGAGADDVELAEVGIDIILTRICREAPRYHHDLLEIYGRYASTTQDEEEYLGDILVSIHSIDRETHTALARRYYAPYDDLTIGLDRADRGADMSDLLRALDDYEGLPVIARMLDVSVDTECRHHPTLLVLDPFYLYDVTSISECFGSRDPHQVSYLLRRLGRSRSSIPMTVGNIANSFLDQLLYRPDLTFDEVSRQIFSMDPLSLATLEDSQVRDVMQTLRLHFDNLKKCVKKDLPKEDITAEESFIEPSFYSAKYGIQGRLDLLKKSVDGIAIVELKSGSPYRANAYGLSSTHYHQTLLYDMLIESAYGRSTRRKNYILYSKEMGNNLRYAPSIKAEQREAIRMRNRLWLSDHLLSSRVSLRDYMSLLINRYKKSITGYQVKDLEVLMKSIGQLDNVELTYCDHLISFAIKEQRLSKLGDESNDKVSGLASMWQDTIDQKKEQFAVINDLVVAHDHTADPDPIVILSRSADTAQLSHFRIGDLVVLYRDHGSDGSVLRDQVFKGTLLAQDSTSVSIRLRSRQLNRQIFANDDRWHVEQDRLESGYYQMTRSVMEWAAASGDYRQLIMGIRAPRSTTDDVDIGTIDGMTDEQQRILAEIIQAKDYYLLWGPPGTGKTSVMLKSIAQHHYRSTEHRILLLAYTNRAVDEICYALSSIAADIDFIRIGSRYSTGGQYRDRLLSQRLQEITRRVELLHLLHSTRIYVGTVASIIGKPQLFDILKFDVAIVDEASQILDTSLIGLLSRVPKFVLIGDHLQLPAVVQQRPKDTTVSDKELRSLGITSVSNSLFERLYKRACSEQWTHAYGQLSHQGRMHAELMRFSNDYFYQHTLNLLPGMERLTAEMPDLTINHKPIDILSRQRLIYIPTDKDWESDNLKTNRYEVSAVIWTIRHLIEIYERRGEPIHGTSIGVITPYRAQIASIVRALDTAEISARDQITVDTVERYQGGARDIVIMSTAVNLPYQMRALISPSEEGIDRKLNVAFTRAREQFILIGGEAILRRDDTYAALIDRCTRLELVDT